MTKSPRTASALENVLFSLRSILLSELFSQLRDVNFRIRSPRTVANYDRSIRAFGESIGKTPRVSDLSDYNVDRMTTAILQSGNSAPTANNYRKQIHSLWRFAYLRGLCKSLPAGPKIAEPEIDLSTWTVYEVGRLFKVFADQPGYIEGVRIRDFLIGCHLLAWDTAERKSTIFATMFDWIDFDESVIQYPAAVRKGRLRSARYPLRPATLAYIDQMRYPVRERLFPVVGRDKWHRNYNALLDLAGLPSGRRNQLHKFRRTVATLYDSAGFDATRLLGNSSRSVTEKHYLDPQRDRGPLPADVLPIIKW